VQRDPALELERGKTGGDLVQAAAVLVERGERLVRLREQYRETTLRLALIAITSASVCFETRSAVRWRVPVSRERIVGSGMSWTFAHMILVPFAARMIAPSILAT
jgi:hypothetical protein